MEYFTELFSSSTPADIKVSLNHLGSIISLEMNESLCKDISPAEIKKAVFSIHPEKTPGPDGMTALFYQKYWKTIGPQVTEMVQEFFNSDFFIHS